MLRAGPARQTLPAQLYQHLLLMLQGAAAHQAALPALWALLVQQPPAVRLARSLMLKRCLPLCMALQVMRAPQQQAQLGLLARQQLHATRSAALSLRHAGTRVLGTAGGRKGYQGLRRLRERCTRCGRSRWQARLGQG